MQGSLSMGVTAPQVQEEVFPFKMQHFTLRNDLLVWALSKNETLQAAAPPNPIGVNG